MQFLRLPYELITDTNITSNEFRIYSYLLSLYNEEKECAYPSIEVIAERTNISIATVKRSIKRLVELGYMIITKKKGLNGNYNEYRKFKYLIKGIVKVAKKTVGKAKRTVKEMEKEAIKPIIVSDCKESGLQMTIDDVEGVKVKQHPNNSKIVKETKIGLTPYYCEAFSHIDETILEMALKEKAKNATLLLKKCIRISKQVGLVFRKEFTNKVLKFKDYKDEYELTDENNQVYVNYIERKISLGLT